MFFADLHCDTLGLLNDCDFFDANSLNNISYDKLVSGNVKFQTFAVCVPCKDNESSHKRGTQFILNYKKIISDSRIIPITDKNSLKLCENYENIGAILALEGCDMLEGDITELYRAYDAGVRILSLTWNNSNSFSGGIGDNSFGLTAVGRKLVSECENLGILIDVSHISEKGFWDIANIAAKPFVATHSNAKAICDNKRNLDNEQLFAIKKSGGCVGINFYPPFLSNTSKATIDSVIAHIDYISGLIGPQYVALGSDFDGVCDNLSEGISGPQDFFKIYEGLLKLNYSQEDAENICGKNFIRILSTVLK